MTETSSFDGSTRVAGHWSTSEGILIWVCVSRADPRNGTALVQIMGIDREQAQGYLGVSSAQLDGVLKARTSVSVLGSYQAGWLVNDGYGPVSTWDRTRGLGNQPGLVCDVSRSS
ncbi:hypothetical protein F2Q69_00005797 [Brassica cretica]|uniref:Uncharacterized protein n=1 Tax=Brassica cretica TaxID=69181 RepID=A0A8S9P148_BRACR|nr:hypothetical protein F2Q69_00005797 [Brassica cretica]